MIAQTIQGNLGGIAVGGIGSGPNGYKKKATVEQSLVLDISALIRRGVLSHDGCSGNINWPGWGAASFRLNRDGEELDGMTLELSYRLGKTERQQLIRFDAAKLTYGRRVFFRCPLLVDESPCQNRAAKLYFRPGGKSFGCRRCNDLTYRSCQDADKRLGDLETFAGLWQSEELDSRRVKWTRFIHPFRLPFVDLREDYSGLNQFVRELTELGMTVSGWEDPIQARQPKPGPRRKIRLRYTAAGPEGISFPGQVISSEYADFLIGSRQAVPVGQVAR